MKPHCIKPGIRTEENEPILLAACGDCGCPTDVEELNDYGGVCCQCDQARREHDREAGRDD